jgi:hypothetical protein
MLSRCGEGYNGCGNKRRGKNIKQNKAVPLYADDVVVLGRAGRHIVEVVKV